MQDEKVHAGDFNIKDHDFPPLSCNMSVCNFLPSSDRSCKLVCANYVCKSKPVTTSNVHKCKLITVSNTRTSKPIRESKPVSTNVSNSTPLIVSCSVSKSKPVRSCPIRTNKPVVSSNVHPCKRVRTSNICKSKPVSNNVSNSTPSIGSCSVSKSKPVHSCPIRTNEPVMSGNFRPCKRVRTSNACKHKSRNHSSKYKRNYLSLFLFFSAVFLEFLLLGIFVNNNFNFLSSNAFYNNPKFLYEAHSNFVYKNHQNFLQSNYSNVFNTFFPFNSFYILKIFIDFTNYVNLVFDIYYYLKILGNTKSFTKSLLTFIFFTSFDFLPLNTLTLSSNSKKENKTKLNSDFLDTFLWVFNLNAHILSIRHKVFSLCQHFSSFWFYMFENFVDFLRFLDFLLIFIGGIFKYLFLLFLPLLIYLFFTLTIIFNSLFIDHNVFDNNFTFLESSNESISNDFLLIKNQTIPASITHKNTIASYNSLIFYSVVMSFSCIFYKKHNFNCAKRFFPFAVFLFLRFNGTPQHESKNTRLKDCHSSEFFSIELITITNSINKAERHLDFCYFALSKLNFKQNKRLKFYQLLILLSGDISLNPGPCQYLSDRNKDLFEPFLKRGFNFLHIYVNSLLLKIDELRDIISRTKPAILGITESKLDSFVSDQEVNISGYSILRSDRNRNGGGVACYIRADLCFNRRNVFSNTIEHVFFDLLIPKVKPISIGIFYRPPNANTFLETFQNDLNLIDFKKFEVYFLGDFNINLLLNNKFLLKERQPFDVRNLSSPLLSKYKELCQTFSLKEIIQEPTRVTSSTSSLLDHILTKSGWKISQKGVIDVGLSDHQLIYCTRKISRTKTNRHNQA